MFYIEDFYIGNRLIEFHEFQNKVGFYNGAELDFNIILNALNKIRQSIIININVSRSDELLRNSRVILYNKLNLSRKEQISTKVENFWMRKDLQFNNKYWLIPLNCTKEVRLRVLQWKVLYNIYPTSILLQKIKIRDSSNCPFCGKIDYLEHFFFECIKAKNIWVESEKIINAYLGIRIELSPKEVFFGLEREQGQICTKNIHWVNHVLLVAKMVISKIKYGKESYSINILENELRKRKLIN